jgi:hypothetical protein
MIQILFSTIISDTPEVMTSEDYILFKNQLGAIKISEKNS